MKIPHPNEDLPEFVSNVPSLPEELKELENELSYLQTRTNYLDKHGDPSGVKSDINKKSENLSSRIHDIKTKIKLGLTNNE